MNFKKYIEQNEISKYDIAANVALAELDGFEGVMSAAQQKKVFGRNIFGRKRIKIDASGQGKVTGNYSVAFGTDSAFFDKSFDDIAYFVNTQTPLHF